MFRILAEFPVKEEKIEEFKEVAGALAAESRKEEGVLSYTINVSTTDPLLFGFFEVYESKAVHSRHEKSPHCSTLFPKMLELLSSDPVIKFFEEI